MGYFGGGTPLEVDGANAYCIQLGVLAVMHWGMNWTGRSLNLHRTESLAQAVNYEGPPYVLVRVSVYQRIPRGLVYRQAVKLR